MTSPTKYTFWKKLLDDGIVRRSSLPKIVKESPEFKTFFNGLYDGAIVSEKIGNGSVLRINESKRVIIEDFFKKTFPVKLEAINNKNDSVAMFRNSKASGHKEKPIFFIKGFQGISVNNEFYDLGTITRNYGLSAFVMPKVECERICFVENKDVFLEAEKLLGEEYIFIHKYGRIGKNDVNLFKTKEILVFSDYDYIGLNEYLLIKNEFENTYFYMPENFEELHNKFSMSVPEKQVPSQLVTQSSDEVVVKVRTILQKENKFLEQQSLFINLKK